MNKYTYFYVAQRRMGRWQDIHKSESFEDCEKAVSEWRQKLGGQFKIINRRHPNRTN